MLFNSYIFIFLFLPVTLLLWYLCNRLKRYKLAQFIIVVLSLVFYSYYNWKDAIVILFSISGNWCFSKWMEREKGNVRIGFIGILFNISILCFFKYWNFLIENVNLVFASQFSLKKIIFPLGISFYTIQQISFIADRMRGAAPHYSLLDYASYVIFFPQLIAGPIVSHEDLVPQFQDNEKRKLKLENLVMGISIFSIGLGKKVLLADSLGRVVDAGFSEIGLLDSISAIVVMLSFTFQLFFDFSGYCDMAAGIGYMMNIKLPQNFDSPYKAASVGEFWKRWHMTLNAFFTQYIYIPLGGGRCVRWKWIRNVMIVFLISGIWHGANWTFIIWGILHGIAVVAERASLFSKWSLKVRWFMTFIFLVLSWVLFRSDSMNMAFQFYKKLFSFSNTGYLADLSGNLIDFKFYFLRSCINRFGGNVAVSSFQILLLILLLILSVVCCTKRSCLIELPQKCLTKKDMLLFAVIFSLSVVSLSGVTIFLYFNF